ncbi:MAG: hypothetical protein ACP5G4_04285 [bacterium]
MKMDTTKVLSLVLIIVFVLIVVSLFTSRPNDEKAEMVVDITQLEGLDGLNAESLLATGETLKTTETGGRPRIDIHREMRDAEVAPQNMANIQRETIAKSRSSALDMRNKTEADLDTATAALLDSIRRVRAKQEAEGRR